MHDAQDLNWLALAHEQLDGFESVSRARLAEYLDPPTGNQAARRRELRRRARIVNLEKFLRGCIQQVTLAREALNANPLAGKAVYHALMAGMLAHYPDTAALRDARQAHREAAIETNQKKQFDRTTKK